MDLTQLFKASVKTVRLRNKSVPLADKSRILKVKTRDDFSIKANDVRYQVTQLRDLLIENRAAYMRFGLHLKTSTQMTDEERNIIDQESEKIITLCSQYLKDLKHECLKERAHSKQQTVDHKLAILEILSIYLKSVFQMHTEQKANRVQHELDTYKLLKLESNKKTALLDTVGVGDSGYHNDLDNTHSKRNRSQKEPKIDNKLLNTSQSEFAIDEENQANKFAMEDDINSDDIQMFESENLQLLNDLKGLSDEVEIIEKNVVGIAKLQEIFTEKVNIQKYDIERIGNVVVGATENIREANEQIKQAIQRNAGLRVWVLFFLIIMSFTLLFLDWYND